MKFRLTNDHTYPWPVTVTIPDPDSAGAVLEQKFTITFRAMPLAEAEALDDEIEQLDAREKSRRQDDVLRRVAIGWDENVVDDDNKPVPFSSAALEQAIGQSWFRIGVYRAYRDSLQGRAAAQGN